MSVIVEKKGPVYYITFNNLRRKNCINQQMYAEIIQGMDEANADEDTFLTVFTGAGCDFYSSGNDFSPANLQSFDSEFTNNPDNENAFKKWVDRLIIHKKALIALVNGPAIGIACTTLSLMDMVIASDKAYVLCPFTQMGLCPEGTSSYTFPKIMGHSKANSLALFAETMNAKEAYAAGLFTKIIPHDKFRDETDKLIQKYSGLAKHSVLKTKELLRNQNEVNRLLAANRTEAEALSKLMTSEETIERIMAKFAPKKNSSKL